MRRASKSVDLRRGAVAAAAVFIGVIVSSTAAVSPRPPINDIMPSPRIDASMAQSNGVPELRVLYFVPSDLTPNPAQLQRILQAAQDVHRWYADHTDTGQSYAWAGSVETVSGLQPLSYYAADFWGSVTGELGKRGYPMWGAEKIFVIWVKGAAQWAGGGQGPAWSGAVVLGGEIFIEDGCVPTHPSEWPCTPGGAMAHELGHALGMPHPDTVGTWGATYDDNTVMHSQWNFPERYARSYTPPSPWGLLNYERDHLRYNPVVHTAGSPYPAPPTETSQRPPLPSPSGVLSATNVGATQTQLSWNSDGANQYYVYQSVTSGFATYAPVGGSPTTANSLIVTDSGGPRVYFKVFEIALSQ